MNQIPNNNPSAYQRPVSEKKGCGCFLTGCLTLIVILVVAVGIGIYGLRSMFYSYVEEYSGEAGIDIPPSQLNQERSGEILGQAIRFQDALEHKEKTQPLIFANHDLEAFLLPIEQSGPEAPILRAAVVGDELQFRGSYKLPFPDRDGKFRYLNANGRLNLKYANEVFQFELRELRVKDGTSVFPENELPWRGSFTKEELRQSMKQNQDKQTKNLAELLDDISGIQLEDNRLIITPHPALLASPEIQPTPSTTAKGSNAPKTRGSEGLPK